jgi:hypothetical protein
LKFLDSYGRHVRGIENGRQPQSRQLELGYQPSYRQERNPRVELRQRGEQERNYSTKMSQRGSEVGSRGSRKYWAGWEVEIDWRNDWIGEFSKTATINEQS